MADLRLETDVRDSYDRAAELYFDHVAGEMQDVSADRAGLRLFAELVGEGTETLDAGCGPGHITAFLASNGLHVSGIDIAPALIELAKASFPGITFRVGELADLPLATSSVGAVVSRHSLIHTEPEGLKEVIAEFARVLTPGGRLLLSFFATTNAAEHGQPFDHAVCTAYQFDPEVLSILLASLGFKEEIRLVRQPRPDERPTPHATLISRHTGEAT